jgi:hypothetical protein
MSKDKTNPGTTLRYPVLTPFKHNGGIVKTPYADMTEEQAAGYIAAGVLGRDGAELPAPDAEAQAPAKPAKAK